METTRQRLLELCFKVSLENEEVSSILLSTINSGDENSKMQLLLDSSTMPTVVKCTQDYGPEIRDRILYIGRTWCYNIHRKRMTQLGLFSYR